PNHISPALHFDPRVQHEVPENIPRTYAISQQPEFTRPDNLEDLAFAPITQLSALIKSKQVSSVELTQMYLARLKKYNPVLECVVTLTEELAMKQAQRADDELAQGIYRSPLHGIPWGAKDLLSTKNYKTTWGAMPYKDQQIDLDATVVQRLEAAGAVLVAKLTMGALAYGDIWFDGRTNNPWDISEGSSGSSAGPGSATAAGLVGFSIGTETLGSIVSPATRNGVTGLRPTYGRVSRYGAMALSWSMDKIGPMCRTVEDCALVFSAIYGADGQDLTLINKSFTWQPETDIQGLRLAYVPSLFEPQSTEVSVGEALDEELIAFQRTNEANSAAVLDVLRNTLNLDLDAINLPNYDLAPLFMILTAEGAAAFDDLTRSNQDDLLKWQVAEAFPNLFRSIRLMSAVEYIQANRVRTKIMQEMAAIMADVDVLVVPSFGGNVLALTNFTGHPAVVLPNGFTPKNTPTSITFIGGLYKEAETLAVARAYQNATDFHLQYPPMDYEG
ncbi:MAG: amidase, partial [Aggregatilineales bacterium]